MLVPALVGAAIALAYVFREQQEFHRESMQETARALALALDRELDPAGWPFPLDAGTWEVDRRLAAFRHWQTMKEPSYS